MKLHLGRFDGNQHMEESRAVDQKQHTSTAMKKMSASEGRPKDGNDRQKDQGPGNG